MTFRLPQNLSTPLDTNTGTSVLEAEILAEHAAALGHQGRLVEKAIKAYEAAANLPAQEQDVLLNAAAEAVFNYFIQREAIGINNHDHPIKFYNITPLILARLGTR